MIGILDINNWYYRIPIHSLSPEIIIKKLNEFDVKCEVINEKSKFSDLKVLVNLYQNVFPISILDELVKFREKGGCLVSILPAFNTLLEKNGDKWFFKESYKVNHENLGLPEGKILWQCDNVKFEFKNFPSYFPKIKKIKSYKHFAVFNIDPLSLPEEDFFNGIIKCEKEGIFKGYISGFVYHNCFKFDRVIDFLGFTLERTVIPRETIEKIIIGSIFYILKEKKLFYEKKYFYLIKKIKKINSPFEAKFKVKKDYNRTLFPRNAINTEKILLLKNIPSNLDEKIFLYSLQGYINKYEKEKVYFGEDFLLELIWKKEKIEIEEIKEKELIEKGLKYTNGAVIYNPKNPTSINIAITYAGVKNMIPVTERIKNKYKLRNSIFEDFSRKFKNSSEGYKWARKNLLPFCRKDIAYHMKHIEEEEELSGKMVDYIVANRIFSFHIDGDPLDEDIREVLKILKELNDIAVISGFFYYNNMYHEGELTTLVSECGKIMVPCYNLNLTVHTSLNIKYKEYFQRHKKLKSNLENKLYVSFIFTDGDNMGYIIGGKKNSDFLREQWWSNKKRGKVPLGWTLGPSIIEIAPLYFEYLYETQTENDNFLLPFGAGYVYGDILGRLYEKEKKLIERRFCDLTEKYMKIMDIKLINSHHTATSDLTYLYLSRINNLRGIFADYNGHPCNPYKANYFINKIPVFHSFEFCPKKPENPVMYIKERLGRYLKFKKPFFVHFSLVNWWFTPEDVYNATDDFENVEVLTPENLVDLFKRYICEK